MEDIQVVVGRIGKPHGIRGEVTLDVRTDEPEKRFAPGSVLRAEAPAGAVVIDVIPLLVEGDLCGRFDVVIVVDVPEEVQVERLRRRDGFTRDEAMRRLAAQASREDRLAVADHVIDNSGDTDALAEQVDRLWDALRRG